MKNAILNVNGQIVTPEKAKVSVFDRSYLYGDSLYEVARTYRGKFFGLKEHLDRLAQSASLARMVLKQSSEDYAREIARTFDAFRAQPGMRDTEAYCRIVVSRGEGRIGFGLECLTSPTLFTIYVQPLEPPTAAQFEKGARLKISDRVRNAPKALDPAMKSGNYLNSLLAYLEAVTDGYGDAIMLNADAHVTEGTTFNVFYVNRGIVATPPLDIGILEGITRREVIAAARAIGIPVREVRFPKERFYEADEVFLSSSIKEVFPITQVDDKKIAEGKPGPITRKLAEAFRKRVAERSEP
jgi:branched-chain amino acid aminotransferase